MGLSAEKIRAGLDAVASNDKRVAGVLERVGYPEPRIRDTGYKTLLRTIVGQQVSVAAASSMWNKLETELGPDFKQMTKRRLKNSPASRGSGDGQPRSICCSLKAAPISGPLEIWQYRKASSACSSCQSVPRKSRPANWPNNGARIAGQWRSSPGTSTPIRRCKLKLEIHAATCID